ncbi:MAG TPA: hypothetical protein V6D04_09300 [Candidatus Obscuribacterales bacterium]
MQLRLQPEGELLTFYREDTGEKLLAPEELAQALVQAQSQAEQERQRADRLAAQLRALGVDPEAE